MATSKTLTDAYSGRSAFSITFTVDRYAVSGTKARWRGRLYARNPSGSTATYTLNNYPWSINIEGQSTSGSHNLDFRSGVASILLGEFVTGWIDQGTSTRVINMSASHSTTSVFGSASVSGSFTADALATVPGAPPAPIFQSATPTSLTFVIQQPPSNGGSPVLDYEMRIVSNDGQTLIGTFVGTGSPQTTPSSMDIDPNTSYRVLYRARNAVGFGNYSSYTPMTTPPATPPGMTVTPSLTGTSASVKLTPPAGATVTSYRVERRPLGGGATSTYNTATSPLVVSPLTPGTSYEWRASAFIGSYQTPWTAWTPVLQPNPNTNPGDYFDGSTAAKTDTSYAWTGTANNSTSRAVGKAPLGWGSFASGVAVSGGAGSVMRASGGRSGGFSARVTFESPTTAAGFHAGLDVTAGRAVTEAGVEHAGLIHVQLPTRAQRLAAMLLWVNAGGVEVGRTVGEAVSVQAGPDWVPLKVTGTAPAGTAGVAVRVIDVLGTNWSLWQGGDVLLIDDAITPFNSFFTGDTPDTVDYLYSWEGTPNNSVSIREENPAPRPDPLADPDCPPVPAPPLPPVIDDACVEIDVVEWRRTFAPLGAGYWTTPAWTELVPTISLTATVDVRQVRLRYYQNPFDRALTDIDPEDFCGEQVITFIPAGAILTIDGISQRVWAEVEGSAQALDADHLLATQQGDTDQWPSLTCGSKYYITIDIPSELPSTALSTEYALTARYS